MGSAGALHSLDELSEERSNLEKAFRWEWDNDDVLKGRVPPGVNPNQAFREGLKQYARTFSCLITPLPHLRKSLHTGYIKYVAFEGCLGLSPCATQVHACQVQWG